MLPAVNDTANPDPKVFLRTKKVKNNQFYSVLFLAFECKIPHAIVHILASKLLPLNHH